MNIKNKGTVGQNVETAMKRRNVSKKKLSEMTGISVTAVDNNISGKSVMNADAIIKYAEALGCSPADFFEGTFKRTKYSAGADLIHMYPYNLACAVMGCDKKTPDAEKWDVAYNTYVPAILGVIDELPEKEKRVIEYRFKNLMTFAEAGKELGLCREGVRRIESKALRMLRHPARSRKWDMRRIFSNTDEEKSAYEKAYETVKKENTILKEKIKKCKEEIAGMKNAETSAGTPAKTNIRLNTDIDFDFDVSCNLSEALRRCGIERAGLLTFLSVDDIMCIKGIGEKGAAVIKKAVNDLGLELCADGKSSTGTIGELQFKNEVYRPCAMIILRSAGIFTMKELSIATQDEIIKSIYRLPESLFKVYDPSAVFTEIEEAATKAGITLC